MDTPMPALPYAALHDHPGGLVAPRLPWGPPGCASHWALNVLQVPLPGGWQIPRLSLATCSSPPSTSEYCAGALAAYEVWLLVQTGLGLLTQEINEDAMGLCQCLHPCIQMPDDVNKPRTIIN